MGVYVKGRKIPESCYDCEFVYWSTKQRASACFLLPFMKCFESHSTEYRKKRSELCPLIEVPEPHGRLIDADALDVVLKNEAESLDVNVYACGIADGLSLARSCIETASTIIPANGEG